MIRSPLLVLATFAGAGLVLITFVCVSGIQEHGWTSTMFFQAANFEHRQQPGTRLQVYTVFDSRGDSLNIRVKREYTYHYMNPGVVEFRIERGDTVLYSYDPHVPPSF